MHNKDFKFIDNNFINFYSESNPILEDNDPCYFLFTSTLNYHVPIIGKGFVTSSEYMDGMHKLYNVQLIEIIETKSFIFKWVRNNFFDLVSSGRNYGKGVKEKQIYNELNDPVFLCSNFFPVECFFVRQTIEEINLLKKEYMECILEDLNNQTNQLKDMLEIINSTEIDKEN